MTVIFTNIETPEAISQYYANHTEKVKNTEGKQSFLGYYFQLFFTTSETKPVKWFYYDGSSFVTDPPTDTYNYFLELGKKRMISEGWTGYKISCLAVDMLNSGGFTPQFSLTYSKEVWTEPKKVYINGPKKSKDAFLAKKGKQFV